MDELRAFLNPSSKAQPTVLRGPATGGVRLTKHEELNTLNRKEEHRRSVLPTGTDYVREVQKRETELYVQNEKSREQRERVSGGLESLENLSSLGCSLTNLRELNAEAMNEVYSKYSFQMKEDTKNLPINDYRQEILDRITGYPVTIIEGPTGSGKTTQVPQWILDDNYKNRKPCKIVVTQPRRIAAMSIAKRVAQERGWDVGGLVGYQVGLENKTSKDTRIHYVTTGVLLQKLVNSKTLNEYTHIILDEVHERGQEMDFLLIVVKRLLYTVSPGVKVVLMSATFNTKSFADYFMIPTPKGLDMASCIKVVKKEHFFTVKTFYLNDLKKFGAIHHNATPKPEEPGVTMEMHHLVVKLIDAFERIDAEEDDYENRATADLPSILIFLPGINEIEDLYICLNDLKLRAKIADSQCANYKWWVLPLHSTITADEQVRVFQRAAPGRRKIILATNIAESSITVPDIKYVVDYCLMKTLVADDNTNFTTLQLSWASKTNCEQRAGRAGRVRDGRVYRLISSTSYEKLDDECTPEIKRSPLERLVLLAKMVDMGPPSDVLALAMDPPDVSNIYRTVLVLKEVGALKKLSADGQWCPSDGEVTYLGRLMARLPLNVRASKLIMLGHIFGVLEETIIMAAAMSVKSIFSNPFRERLRAYNSKLTWADGSTSDCITFLNVYKVWRHLRQQNEFRSSSSQVQWARQFFLQVRALRELDELARELRARMSRDGLDPLPSPWTKQQLPLVLKIILAGAFYPQYYVQVSPDEDRERDAVKNLGGLNPRNTVYLKDFPANQPGEIYAPAIRNVVRDLIGDEPRVTFDKNSRKVYLSFPEEENRMRTNNGDPTIPGQVVLPIYKAVKARQLKMDIRLPLLPQERANELAAALEQEKTRVNVELTAPRLPELDDTHIPIKISHLVTVSRFWCQHDDPSSAESLARVQRALNGVPLVASTSACAGDVLAAPYADATGSVLCRARVLRLLPKAMIEVRYIDYGNFGRVHSQNLYELPTKEECTCAPLAFECALAEVAPSPLLDAHQQWTRDAQAHFTQLVAKGPLFGKVYSVAHGVVSVELFANRGQVNVNQMLLKNGYAVPCEESYESKLNHDLRQIAEKLSMAQKRAHNKEQLELACIAAAGAAHHSAKECISDCTLKGPYSPLETNVHNMMFAGRDKEIVIEWNSVNSVLLDTEPQEMYERLLVAAEVGQNERASKLTLRHTTLMPNIPGLPALVALLFCPTAELRRDVSCSRYVSSLCGLGSADDGAPYFPEHDLLVNIDADLTINDIELINHIRHLMDYMLFCEEGRDAPEVDPDINVPKLIHRDLLKLVMTRRTVRGAGCAEGGGGRAWEWRTAPEEEVLDVAAPDMLRCAVVFPLHAPLDLRCPDAAAVAALKRGNDDLKTLLTRTSQTTNLDLSCKLCGSAPMSMHAMRIHLYSNAHRQKEEDLAI